MNNGFFPLWIFNKNNRIPNTTWFDYLSILKIFIVKPSHSVEKIFGKSSKIFKYFWEPLTLGIMNTECKSASAFLLGNVIKKSFFRGGKFCKIYQPKVGWNNTIIDPAIMYLKRNNVDVNFKYLLKKVEIKNNLVSKLKFQNNEFSIGKSDEIILCLPPNSVQKIFPELKLPQTFNTILNIHYKYKKDLRKNFDIPIIGILNSKTHWIFIKKNYLSVTISNANDYNNNDSDQIAKIVWTEISESLKIKGEKMPEYKVLREKKATYEQSPSNYKLVRQVNNLPRNLKLAGDWTEKYLPSTIESSILSGKNSVTK